MTNLWNKHAPQPTGSATRRPIDGGFAVLAVMSTLVALSLAVAPVVAASCSEARISLNLQRHFLLEQAVEGAVHLAVFHLMDQSDKHWGSNGATHDVSTPRAILKVRINDEADRVNINTASADLLRELLVGINIDTLTAEHLAAAIVDWRDPGHSDERRKLLVQTYYQAGLDYVPPEAPFRSIHELSLVVGMTRGIVAQLIPHVTIASTYGPTRSTIDPVVFQALSRVREAGGVLPQQSNASTVEVVRISVSAEAAEQSRVYRTAIVRLDARSKDKPFTILDWRP